MPQPGFFHIDRRLESISRMGDPRKRLAAEIPCEWFRSLLAKVLEKDRKSAAGRKPLDVLPVFKILVLQTLDNLADEAVEHQIRDQLAFMHSRGLEMPDRVPDGTMVWRLRKPLKALELTKPLSDPPPATRATSARKPRATNRSPTSNRRPTVAAPRCARGSSPSAACNRTAWAASSSAPSARPERRSRSAAST